MIRLSKDLYRIDRAAYYDAEAIISIFFNEKMKKDGVLIRSESGEAEEGVRDTEITVYFLSEIDAAIYTRYWDSELTDIQVYGIVKNIYDLYLDNSFEDFEEIMKEMSVQYISQFMQSDPDNAHDLRGKVQDHFNSLPL